MSKNLSVFLDLLRLGAALLVLVGHAGEVYHMHLPAMIGHSAKEGVAIFFVLSGFVIAFVTADKENDWGAFARARALRMYSVVPLAIAVLILCHVIGIFLDDLAKMAPAEDTLRSELPSVEVILRYLTFTNELWFNRAIVTTGAPFWSLAFEMAYYVAFALFFYNRGIARWVLPLVWLLVVGPRVAIAFPLWLIGVAAWHLISRVPRLDGTTGCVALAVIALAAAAWRKWVALAAIPLFEWPEPGRLMASMGYYCGLAVLVAAAIVTFAATAPERLVWPAALVRAVRFCAGASFTLYIAHLPVMVMLANVWPWTTRSAGWAIVAVVMTVATMFVLAELGERRKTVYARFFVKTFRFIRFHRNRKIHAID